MPASYLAQKRHRLRKLRGETAYVDATPARLHIATLTGAGWSLRAIAAEAGVSPVTVSRLNSATKANAAPETIRRILTVEPGTIATKTYHDRAEPFVSRVGTVRRIQALLFMGWGHQQMRDHSGITTACVLHQQGRWVTRTTHDAIAAMYRDLSHRRGPSSKATTYAVRRGYAGPADWHDIDHDPAPSTDHEPLDEDDYLDEAAILRRMAGDRSIRLTQAEATELVRRWAASDRSLNECERITGIKPDRHHRLKDQEAAS